MLKPDADLFKPNAGKILQEAIRKTGHTVKEFGALVDIKPNTLTTMFTRPKHYAWRTLYYVALKAGIVPRILLIEAGSEPEVFKYYRTVYYAGHPGLPPKFTVKGTTGRKKKAVGGSFFIKRKSEQKSLPFSTKVDIPRATKRTPGIDIASQVNDIFDRMTALQEAHGDAITDLAFGVSFIEKGRTYTVTKDSERAV